jgi:hypothetical protein
MEKSFELDLEAMFFNLLKQWYWGKEYPLVTVCSGCPFVEPCSPEEEWEDKIHYMWCPVDIWSYEINGLEFGHVSDETGICNMMRQINAGHLQISDIKRREIH